MSEQIPLEESIGFAENPEPRCPCVLLVDTSGSMGERNKIGALNEGLKTFETALREDPVASVRVEVAVIAFDSEVRVLQDFVTADKFDAPKLEASGLTFMGSAVERALDLLDARKDTYRRNGVSFYRPWAFLITDGEPQGEDPEAVTRASRRIADAEQNRRVAFFAVGVDGANMGVLQSLSARAPVRLQGLNFREMFLWLSSSMKNVSRSRVGDAVVMPPPAGWTSVD